MGPFRCLVWAGVASLVLACAASDARIAREQDAFDAYPLEVQEKIRAGEIGVGFTEEQVLMALGEPDERTQLVEEDAVAEVWTWRKTSPGMGFGLGTGSYRGNVGIGTGISVGRGSRTRDERVVQFVGGRVTRYETPIED